MDRTISKKQDNLRDDYQVVKGNILNEAVLCKNTTLVEYRILLVALSKISPLSNSLTVYFRAEEFCKLLGLRRNGMYSYIKDSSKNLASRTLTIENKTQRKGITFAWLSEIKYDESFITITFNHKLEEHILEIRKKGGYTKYFIKNILYLDSLYAIRLYELLKQYQKIGLRTISLYELKAKIGAVKKSYDKMFLFRKYVLIPSKNRVNICTDLVFDYEEIKNGRDVTDIRFFIQSKSEISDDYKTLRKDKLILEIQRMIHNKTGYIFEAKHMNSLHRTILMDLLNNLSKGAFNSILIRNPENFFIYKLDEIQNNYDLNLLNKKYEDY